MIKMGHGPAARETRVRDRRISPSRKARLHVKAGVESAKDVRHERERWGVETMTQRSWRRARGQVERTADS